jgi:predicted RNA binding protein YcfA (HicA-like mRNA interferase family)
MGMRRCTSSHVGRFTWARIVLAALFGIGWEVKCQSGSHEVLARPGEPDAEFASHDRDEIGPRTLARIAKHTGPLPEDLLTAERVVPLRPPDSRDILSSAGLLELRA